MKISDTNLRTLFYNGLAVLLFNVTVGLSQPAMADIRLRECSTEQITGSWVFATNVGKFPERGITAIGTMNIESNGDLDGLFDVTIATTTESEGVFLPGNYYSGSVTVNDDCTGTLSFVTAQSTRTDSIVILSNREMLAMSQDPGNLWNYQIRRLPSRYFRFNK